MIPNRFIAATFATLAMFIAPDGIEATMLLCTVFLCLAMPDAKP